METFGRTNGKAPDAFGCWDIDTSWLVWTGRCHQVFLSDMTFGPSLRQASIISEKEGARDIICSRMSLKGFYALECLNASLR